MRKQLAIISILTMVSQLAAFVKLWFTARVLGVGPEMDGYNLSIVLPTMLAGVAAGVLQTGLFPVRARLNVACSAEDVFAFERSVLLVMTGGGCVISLLLVAASPLLVDGLAASAPATVRGSLAFAFPFIATLVVLNFIGDSCGYLLAMRDRFAIAAAAPVVNGMVGAVFLAVWPDGGLSSLVAGTVLGLIFQVSICVWGLKAAGFKFWGQVPSRQRVMKYWREMISLGGWILPGVILSNFVVSLPPLWASKYGEGAVSAFGYAYRLHSSALQLLVIACSTVILARFSDLIARNELRSVRSILVRSSMFSVAIGLVGMLLVWQLGAVCLEWLFGGRFDTVAAARVADHWLLLTLGLPFAMVGNVFAKLWQAQERPQLISVMASLSLLTLIMVYFFTSDFLGEFSLPIAISMAGFSVCAGGVFFIDVLRRHKF